MTPNFKAFIIVCAVACFATLSGFKACTAHADNDEETESHQQLSRMDKTDAVWMVSIDALKQMTSAAVKVPHVVEGTPLLCFRSKQNQKQLDCFYRNNTTGAVRLLNVASNLEGV